MKLSSEKVLIGFFISIIAGVILLGVANYNNSKSYYTSSRWVDHTNEVLKETTKTLSTLQDIGIRGFITTGDSTLLEAYLHARKALPGQLDNLKAITKDNPTQLARMDSLDAYAQQRIAMAQKYLIIYDHGKLDNAALSAFTSESKVNMNYIRKITGEINQAEEELLKVRKAKAEKSRRAVDISIALVFGLITILLAVLMAAIISYFDTRRKYEKSIIQLNTDLENNISQLHHANKELESFSYSVSHDLRAPLRIIDGFAKIISEEYTHKLDDEGKRFIDTIRNSAQHMGMLIDDLLNFSRVGRQDMTLRETNMTPMVEHVIESIKLIDPNLPADIHLHSLRECRCDEHLMRQVWTNLISNAVKYSRNKNKPVIIIGSDESTQELIYFVKDNGVGFNMEFAGKLFGVFQRLHKPSDYEGTGVGLALVNRIVTRHQGRVWADAKEGEGATFYFSIPK